MSLAPAAWLDRVAQSLCDHEDRQSSLQSYPPRYEVLGEISRGGMGIIYRAWDPQLGRNVALKVLRAEEGNLAEVHERFAREARLAAGLHHPHIVPIYDTGTWNGQDYIAMQLIEGTTLDRARPDVRTALAAVRDAARGLHCAHEQGIVHRDVKPANLLLDLSGRVYVTDFGVARHAVGSATLTSPGTVVGTPAYMSPEQAMGLETGPRSDVYSLGATLYELVTGRPPFAGKDAAEVVEAVRSREPAAPRELVPDLSKNVEAIILAAMERSVEERYASAAEFADDIDRYLNGERPHVRPRGTLFRFRRAWVRHPWRSTAAIVFCLLLLLAGIAAGYAIRGYVYLARGRQAKTNAEKKGYFAVARSIFSEADRELKRIERGELEERDRIAGEARAEEKRRLEEEQRRKDRELEDARAELKRIEDDQKRRSEAIQKISVAVLRRIHDKNFKEARALLEDLRKEDPARYEDLSARIREGEFDEGVVELGRLASKAESEPFGKLFAELSDAAYQTQRDRNVRLAQPAFQLAQNLAPRSAMTWFDAAESLGLRETRLYERRGLAHLTLENWESAQRDLEELLARSPAGSPIAPKFALLAYRRATQAVAAENWGDSFKEFETAIRIDPTLAAAYHDRGLARFRARGLAREALEQDLHEALSKNPALVPHSGYRDVVSAFVRAQAESWKADEPKEREKAWRDCLVWLDLLLRHFPEDADLRLQRAAMRRRLREYAPALEDLRGLEDRFDVLLLRGKVRYAQAFAATLDLKRLAEARDDFDRASRLDPKSALALYWRGTCRQVLKETAGALDDFKRSRDLGLDSTDLRYQIASILEDQDQHAAALQETTVLQRPQELTEEEFVAILGEHRGLSRAAASRGLRKDLLVCRGMAHFGLKEFTACVEDCSQAIKLDPQASTAYLWRGAAACQDKHHPEARKDFDVVIQISRLPEEKERAMKLKEACARHAHD